MPNEFEMSSFVRSKEMTRLQNFAMGHMIPITRNWGTVSYHKANNSHDQLVYKIWSL